MFWSTQANLFQELEQNIIDLCFKRRIGVMIIFEVIKHKAWKLATSHCTHSISSRPPEVVVFTSLEMNLQSHFSEHWRALRLRGNAPYTLILKLV